MAAKSLPHASYLNECFDLNRETYELFWKTRPLSHFKTKGACKAWNTRYTGKKAGFMGDSGYTCVGLNGLIRRSHRIIHKILTGEDYTGQFDHKDTCRTNNCLDNLRKATNSQNMANTTMNEGRYMYRGVHLSIDTVSYISQICVDTVQLYLGSYTTTAEAHAAYCLAAMHFRKEFAHFGKNSCFSAFPLTLEFIKKARHYIEKADKKLSSRKTVQANLVQEHKKNI